MNIESLEPRRLMAATITLSAFGTLKVNGTPDAETINIKAEKSKIRVEVLTLDATDPDALPSAIVWRRFDAKRVSHIIITGGAGDDRASVKLPKFAGKVDFWGDDGNDAASLNFKGRGFLVGGDGADSLVGGSAADVFLGEEGNDDLDGGGGNDTIRGGDGMDALRGGNGKDLLDGGAGIDLLYGGAHNDVLIGGAGCDAFYGEAGNDIFRAQDGEMDAVLGGTGTDTAYLDVGIGMDILTKAPGAIASFRMMTDVETVR